MSSRDPLAYVLGCGAVATALAIVAGGVAGFVLLEERAEATPVATAPAPTTTRPSSPAPSGTQEGPWNDADGGAGIPAEVVPEGEARVAFDAGSDAGATARGRLVVRSDLAALVYVDNEHVGLVGEALDVLCGRIQVGLASGPARDGGVEWLGPPRTFDVACGGSTTIDFVIPPRDVLVALDAIDGTPADRAVLQAFPASLRRCYLLAAEGVAALPGRVRMRADIDGTGSVNEASTEPESAPGVLQSCLNGRMAAAQFPPGNARAVGLTVRFTPVRN